MSPFRCGLHDDRFGFPGKFDLLRCRSCKHIALDAVFSPEELTRLYTDFYARRSYDLSKHRPYTKGRRIGDWLNGTRSAAYPWVSAGVRVLDIGCGSCESLGYLKKIGCDTYGVESDENVRTIADRFGYNVHIGVFDSALYGDNFFDVITMNQVIEHMTDPPTVLKGAWRILRPGGSVVVTTPNAHGWGSALFGRKWLNWHVPYHVNMFSRRSMRNVATAAGFELTKEATITASAWLDYQWYHLLTFPEIGTPSSFWTPGTDKSFMDSSAARFLRTLHRHKINHLLSRFFDALNFGDNFVFVLQKKGIVQQCPRK